MTTPASRPGGTFFPKRTIHLDFHTSSLIGGIGAEFDPDDFADTIARADVDSVTVFAKCHHGRLYYETARPERHPGLADGFGLLEAQVEALHSRGIRAPIYLSVQVDEYAAATHPEWLALDAESRVVKRGMGEPELGVYDAGWSILDMSSPYQDFLVDQVTEVLEHFGEVDGLFLDMCWDQPSSSRWAIDGAVREGLDPEDPADRDRYARLTALRYMERFRGLVEPHLAADVASGVWFNSRPKTNLARESEYLRHIEVESLPTGGWGYAYLPYIARFVRPLGLPALSHTGRFHRSWGDNAGIKPAAALAYETGQIFAFGLTNGVGDVLHPSGRIDHDAYDVIGAAYSRVRALEPFVEGATPAVEAAMVVDPGLGDAPGASGIGAVRALQQLRVQFDIVPPTADLTGYDLVIIPESTVIDGPLRDALESNAARGGAVLVVGEALIGPDGGSSLAASRIEVDGMSGNANDFIRAVEPGAVPLVPRATVVYDRGVRIRALEGGSTMFDTVEPYFDRTWAHFCGHSYTPPATSSDRPAVVVAGRVASIASPLFTSFGRFGNPAHREVLSQVLDRILPDRMIRAPRPAHLETTVWDTPTARVVTLTSYIPIRVGDTPAGEIDVVYDAVPLVDLELSIAADEEPARVTREPGGEELHFRWSGGVVETTVTILDGQSLVVLHRKAAS